MTILQQPDALSFSMNLKPFKISTSVEVEFSLSQGGETLLTEILSPDEDGLIELSLRDIIHDRLSCNVPPTSDPYQQTSVVSDFTAVIGSTSVTFRVIRGGVDRLADTVPNFVRANFLTWQPNVKPVTYSSPEFLSYYAVDSGCTLKVKAYFTDASGNVTPGAEKTICNLVQNVVTTVPVQYALIAGLYSGNLPVYYDVWVASGSTALTYTQRYYAGAMRSEEEQWVFFENSLGGIDTFRTFGAVNMEAKHGHHIAEIDDVAYEYRVDTERYWTVNTGHLDVRERRWLLDFFPSEGKYIYAGSAVRRIVITDDSVAYRYRELPSSYSFTFRFAETLPLLNLPRHELPVQMLDVTVPDVGSFSLPPRLLEFSRLPLSEGVLFPVQSPYEEEWKVVTAGGIANYVASLINIPSPGLKRADLFDILGGTPRQDERINPAFIDLSDFVTDAVLADYVKYEDLEEILGDKLDTRFFANIFTVYDANGTAIVPNTYTQVADNLKIMVGTWTEQYLSALGLNDQGGGGGGTGTVTSIKVGTNAYLDPDTDGIIDMSGYVITSAERTQWGDAYNKRHTHSNKSVLDGITAAKVTSWDNVASIMGTDSDSVINKWNEVVAFLAGVADQSTLSGLLGAKANSSVTISAGDGLQGGGNLSADFALAIKLQSNSGLVATSSGLKLDVVNALNSTITYKALSAAQGKALNDRLAILEAMFTREGSGTSASPYVIKANYGLYTEQFLSALGMNSQGGGGGAGLGEVWQSLTTNTDDYANYKIHTGHIPTATSSAIGGIKVGYTTSNKNYKVQLDSSNNAYVNVPWTDHYDWSDIANKPSTFAPSAHTHTYIEAKGVYTFDSSTLPNSFDLGVSAGFVNSNSGFGSYGSVLTVRTFSGGGGSLQLYAPYSSSHGGTHLKARFGDYGTSSGNSWTTLKDVAWVSDIPTKVSQLTNDSGYITSSASITGNAATATKATQDGSGNTITSTYLPLTGGTIQNSSASYPFVINSTSSTGTWMYFKKSGVNKTAIGYHSDVSFISNETTYAYLCVTDTGNPEYRTSISTAGYTLLHTGNYNSYALPLAGGTLTGALTININATYPLILQGASAFSVIDFKKRDGTAVADFGWLNDSRGNFAYLANISSQGVISVNSSGAYYSDNTSDFDKYTLLHTGNGVTLATAQTISGAKTLTNVLEVTGVAGYAEGIRIHSASDGWTTLILCGSDNTGSSGTSAKSWSMHTYDGTFYFANNGSSSYTTGLTWSGSTLTIKSAIAESVTSTASTVTPWHTISDSFTGQGWGYGAFSPNISSSKLHVTLLGGKSASTNNSGWFGFYYLSSGSAQNYAGIGIYGTSLLFRVYPNGSTVATSEVTASSDARKKNIIGDATMDINYIANAPNVLFKWKDKRDDKIHGGSIAQYYLTNDKAKHYVLGSEEDTYSLSYGALGVTMGISIAKYVRDSVVTKLNTHESEIEKLKKKVKKQQQTISELLDKVDVLEQKVA